MLPRLLSLACVLALLNLPDEAMRQLRICLARDPEQIVRKLAATDPDLKMVRRHPEYRKLFEQSVPQPSTLAPAPIKNR